jgi:hypothetical protein
MSIIILIIITGFFTGSYFYKINELNRAEEERKVIAIEVDDECTEISELEEQGLLDLQRTNAGSEKVSPNTTLVIKKFYKKCNHIIQNQEKIPVDVANLSEEEFKEKYNEWEVQKFTNSEIVLYKEIDDFCHEHYLLKDENDFIAIYELNEKDEEVQLIRVTDIATQYLTDTDLIKLQSGMIIYTNKELNKVLEDFE